MSWENRRAAQLVRWKKTHSFNSHKESAQKARHAGHMTIKTLALKTTQKTLTVDLFPTPNAFKYKAEKSKCLSRKGRSRKISCLFLI